MALPSIPPPGAGHKLARLVWGVVWLLLYRPSPTVLHGWRRLLLRLFGAQVEAGAHPYPSASIWAPWNLRMGRRSCLGPGAICYNVAPVTIEAGAVVSQHAYLCTASHLVGDPEFTLVGAPITVAPAAWVAAGAFVGPGVTIGKGSVVGARAVVMKDVTEGLVVIGNPARPARRERLGDAQGAP